MQRDDHEYLKTATTSRPVPSDLGRDGGVNAIATPTRRGYNISNTISCCWEPVNALVTQTAFATGITRTR